MSHAAITLYKSLPSVAVLNSWESACEKHQSIAKARKTLITELAKLEANAPFSRAYASFKQSIRTQLANNDILLAVKTLNNKVPSANTLKNWINDFEQRGLNGLLPKHKGSVRSVRDWEHIALERYHRPQKPSIRKVSRELIEDYGFADATEHNVRYFFSQLPADLGEYSRWRIGSKLYRDSQRQHIVRHTENMNVGEVYQADGHTIDVYLRHPNSGKLWRAELTVFQDMKSRFIVGWYLSCAESSITTMAALSHAVGTYDHVPLLLYIDNGCGFKSKLMNDDTAGFYASFGIETVFAIPGNAKAKGNVERFFRVMEEDLNKNFDTYCGKDMSPDLARHFSSAKMHKFDELGIYVPTQQEWCDAFTAWLDKYHNRPHPEYKNTTPAAMWAQLEKTPVHDMSLLIKPRANVKVTRGTITHQKRMYEDMHLHQFNDQELVAEYDIHDDSTMRIFDKKGMYLLTVRLKQKRAAIPTSRLEEMRENSRKASIKRLHNKIASKNAEYIDPVASHAEQVEVLDAYDINEAPVDAISQKEEDMDITALLIKSELNTTTEDDSDELDLLSMYNN